MDLEELKTRLQARNEDGTLAEITEDDQRQAADTIERLQRENEILRHEREHAKAHYDYCVRILSRIHNFITPKDVTLPDGRRFEFNNPAIEHEMLRALSEAIRAIPDELKKAENAQPNKEWQ